MQRRRGTRMYAVALGTAILSACASTASGHDYDPLEPMNRKIHWFNDHVDRYFVEPVARGYAWVLPDPVEDMISNFIRNLRFPLDLVNNLLQGKPKEAGEETLRFLANSTIGIGGLFDPASECFELSEHNEDFGQTFAVWGIPAGPYLVLPLLGPSNFRDGIGLIPDAYGGGALYVFQDELLWGYAGLSLLSLRTDLLEEIDSARQASLDYYVFTRNAYGQLRELEITDKASTARWQRGHDQPEEENELYDDDLYDDGLYNDELYDDELYDDSEPADSGKKRPTDEAQEKDRAL